MFFNNQLYKINPYISIVFFKQLHADIKFEMQFFFLKGHKTLKSLFKKKFPKNVA